MLTLAVKRIKNFGSKCKVFKRHNNSVQPYSIQPSNLTRQFGGKYSLYTSTHKEQMNHFTAEQCIFTVEISFMVTFPDILRFFRTNGCSRIYRPKYLPSTVNISDFLGAKLYLINVFINRSVLLCGRAKALDMILYDSLFVKRRNCFHRVRCAG